MIIRQKDNPTFHILDKKDFFFQKKYEWIQEYTVVTILTHRSTGTTLATSNSQSEWN